MHRIRIAVLVTLLLFTSSSLGVPPVAAQAPGPALSISQIQGQGATSPYAGQKLSHPVRGCVTGVAAEGFFIQDSAGDGDPATSDGVYVYRYSAWKNPRGLKPGDLVEILTYKVMEFYEQTELSGLPSDKNEAYRVVGACPLPAPVAIPLLADQPGNGAASYEPWEGMRVIVDLAGSVVGPTERFESRHPAGDPEITVVPADSLLHGQRIFARELPIDQGTLALSGGLGVDLPEANVFDRVQARGLTGVLAYQFGRYVLLVDNPRLIEVQRSSTSLASFPSGGPDTWTVCTLNAENLFDAVDDRDGDFGAWAPPNDAAYRAGLARRATTLREHVGACTLLAVQEIEGKDAVWADLAEQLGPRYRFDYYESADARDITVGLIYDADRVELQHSSAAQSCRAVDYGVKYASAQGPRSQVSPCSAGGYPLYDRPPYVADLVVASERQDRHIEVRLVVVHLKSKRGDEAENAPRRLEQARHVAQLLGEGASRRMGVAVGDFNDDLGSAPLEELAAYVNLYLRHVPAADQYSYVYNGRSQALDHIVMTPALDAFYLLGGPVHINADYAEPLPGAAGRTSDHDPLVVRFGFEPTGISPALIGAASGAAGYHQPFRLK